MNTIVQQKPVKTIYPKIAEAKYIGSEPTWERVNDSDRGSAILRAFSWYNYLFAPKDAKDFIVEWLARNGRTTESKTVSSVSDKQVSTSVGWFCRMASVGLSMTDKERAKVDSHISSLVAPTEKDESAVVESASAKPNIQDRLREKMSECAAELEGLYDDFVLSGAKTVADFKPINVIRTTNVAPHLVSEISTVWQVRLLELQTVQAGKDAQLVEGYSHYGKIQLRNLVKFTEQVVADCASYLQIKKVERKPRAKKPIPKEKIVSKLKYQREDTALKLRSVSPTDIIGASELWLYDTAKRKLIHYVADSHVGSFSVKGGSLVGFDSAASTQKTLRNPAEQIKTVMGSKPAARKNYAAIKAVESKLSGRFNENIIILRAF